MAKGQNLVVLGNDGKIVVVGCGGDVKCDDDEKLKTKVAGLIGKRQKAGIDISRALEKAGFDVCATQESFVLDAVPPRKSSDKKSSGKKSSRKKK